MAWSIAEVSRMSGVTSRTLRHYDAIGLLPPARTGSNGLRYYEESELLRLQQILLMRELGVGLREIRAALDSRTDRVTVLREHHQRLLAERHRLETLARTVARTIAELEDQEDTVENNGTMKINRPENLFEGFDPDYDDTEVRERWPAAWEEAQPAIQAMTDADKERWQREVTAQMIRLADLMAAGAPAAHPAVQAEIATHYQGVCQYWTPNAEAYKGLGRTYVEDPRMRANYDKIAPGLAEYQAAAMTVYADDHLN
ncbi:MerR family transcriptional regulator [Streptomyces varsoviensis]|uniref:MerR family transcriptional regulator n=1 Tax=Streptomyces varsoviensis TaxID=67373 RepID=UPI0033CF6E8C